MNYTCTGLRTPKSRESRVHLRLMLKWKVEMEKLMERLYFDHNATTPVAVEVLEAMLPFLTGNYGNPSSIHSFGQQARAAVEDARVEVARLLNCRGYPSWTITDQAFCPEEDC